MSATLLAFALAAEIGAAAPDALKPCPKPAHVQKSPKSVRVPAIRIAPTHIRKLKEPPTDCGEKAPAPFAMLFPEKLPLLDYTPAPEQETFAAAQVPDDREVGSAYSFSGEFGPATPGAAAFNTSFGPILIQQPALFQVAPAPELPTAVTIAFGLAAMGFVLKRRA